MPGRCRMMHKEKESCLQLLPLLSGEDVCKRAGISRHGWHGFRRGLASNHRRNGEVVIYEAFVEGMLEAPKPSIRATDGQGYVSRGWHRPFLHWSKRLGSGFQSPGPSESHRDKLGSWHSHQGFHQSPCRDFGKLCRQTGGPGRAWKAQASSASAKVVRFR